MKAGYVRNCGLYPILSAFFTIDRAREDNYSLTKKGLAFSLIYSVDFVDPDPDVGYIVGQKSRRKDRTIQSQSSTVSEIIARFPS